MTDNAATNGHKDFIFFVGGWLYPSASRPQLALGLLAAAAASLWRSERLVVTGHFTHFDNSEGLMGLHHQRPAQAPDRPLPNPHSTALPPPSTVRCSRAVPAAKCLFQRKRSGLKGLRSTDLASPSTINSAMARPEAGAVRMPQQLCPVATYAPVTPGTGPITGTPAENVVQDCGEVWGAVGGTGIEGLEAFEGVWRGCVGGGGGRQVCKLCGEVGWWVDRRPPCASMFSRKGQGCKEHAAPLAQWCMSACFWGWDWRCLKNGGEGKDQVSGVYSGLVLGSLCGGGGGGVAG